MLNKNLKFNTSIVIDASRSEVWDVMVNPQKIKKYLFGTNAISDWTKGSELIFTGEYEGTRYLDKGIILKIDEEKTLQYTYLSSFSNLEDVSDNYSVITFRLADKNGQTDLSLRQLGFVNEESMNHSMQNWKMVLDSMKQLAESA